MLSVTVWNRLNVMSLHPIHRVISLLLKKKQVTPVPFTLGFLKYIYIYI